MKNKTVPAITLLAVALALFSPALASANNGSNGNGSSHNSKSEKNYNNNSGNRDHDDNNGGNGWNGNKNDKDKKFVNPAASTTINGTNVRFPNGIKIAPGIEKKIEKGKELPKGWLNFFEALFNRYHNNQGTTTASTTADIKAPKISEVHAVAGTSSADILWRTNEITSSELRFSTSTNVSSSSSAIVDSSLLFNHSAHLVNLTPNTLYHYVITATDASGNVKTKAAFSFKTKPATVTPVPPTPVTDITPPNIQYNLVYDLKATSTNVFWVTDELADSKVWVSTSTPVSASGTPSASSATLVNHHILSLDNLATSTAYYYLVSSSDSSGNTSTTTGSFTTSAI